MNNKPRNPNAMVSFLIAFGVIIIGGLAYTACTSSNPVASPDPAPTVTTPADPPTAASATTPPTEDPAVADCTEYSDWLARLNKDLDDLNPSASDAQAELDRIQKGLDDLAAAATQANCLDEIPDIALPEAEPTEPAAPEMTASQANAVEKAGDYLDYAAFSRKGLITQLKFEKFSTADASFAVDHITVNWNEQAAKTAKDYLEYSSFSRSGLIEQLEFEGFTAAQARHGVKTAGL